MAEEPQARIIVGASPVAGGQRHTYLLFEQSDGTQVVVRGGPDARTEGNDVGNLIGSTVLGSDNFGHIRVDAARYVAPYDAYFQRGGDGRYQPIPVAGADPADPSLARDAQGRPVRQTIVAPDWPQPGEQHERRTVWIGSDAELAVKLDAALRAGDQINNAQLEYSPLYNNSNGVTSNLLRAAAVTPRLPNGADGKPVGAPNFGEDLYQDVGTLSHRSGYRFNGTQWTGEDGRRIQPPHSGQPVVPMNPNERPPRGSFDSSALTPDEAGRAGDMRDPGHRDNGMFRQAYAGVSGLDCPRGGDPQGHDERVAAALATQCKAAGLDRIERVALSPDGSRAFAVDQADPHAPWARHAHVDLAQAAQQPVAESNQRLAQLNGQQDAARQQAAAVQGTEEPGRSAPRLA
ncbi:XVIPCD domain-containing protein [Lysobacter enzymogenes]|uniref:XVIPCD domain-containing protein n=1 Tax=Lysobacter enzymogenes TaxID=69 RepID=UPI00384F3B88